MTDRQVVYRLRGDVKDFVSAVNLAETALTGSLRNMQLASRDGLKAVATGYGVVAKAADGARVKVRLAETEVSGSFRRMRQESSRGGAVVAGNYNLIAKAAGGAEFKVKGLVTSIAGFAIGGGGLAALATNAVQAADEIAKVADKLGVSTDELQRYQFAAELSGIQTKEFNTAFQRFGRRIGEVAQGFGEARGAITALNIDVRNLDGTLRPVNEVFDEAIQKLSQVEDVTLRNALAAKLFDSEGVKLVQLGNNLANLKTQAGDLGLIIPEELLRNAESLNDKLTIVQKTLAVKLTAALIKFAPQLDALANGVLVVADNFDAIVAAIATFAKLLVAVKLGAFIQTMYGVGVASVAAAGGVNALRIALQGLKAATFVGLGLIALEIVIKKFLDSVDDTGDAIAESMEDAQDAVAAATDNIAQTYDDVSSELIQQRQEYNDAIDDLVKAEIKSLEDGLKAQEQVVREQKRLLTVATRDAKKAADEFQEAFDQIRGNNAKIENPDLIDFAAQITEARRLLAAGDHEGAVEAALKAKDVVLALQETGDYTQAQLEGTLKKALDVQQAASGALVDQQQSAVNGAETALQKIQSQINLIKSISFEFDETKSLEGARQVLAQIKNLIANQPIVVPVELRPVNGVDAGSVSVPGYASGGPLATGPISGPGTPTSDSILAMTQAGSLLRLADKEWIMPYHVRKYYGDDFMWKLMARKIPRFASGGPINAGAPRAGSGSTPINLTVGGHTYAMSADPEVAAQLRRETHMEQLKKGSRR